MNVTAPCLRPMAGGLLCITTRHRSPAPSYRAAARASVMPLAVAALLAAGTSIHAQQDNFDDGDANGWTEYDPVGAGSFSSAGGVAYRIQSGPSPNPAFGPGRAGSVRSDVSYDSFYVMTDIVDWDNALDQSIGLMARLREIGLGTTDGYALTYQVSDGDITITRFLNEDPAGGDVPTTGNGSFFMVPGNAYRLVFQGVGSTLTARLYELPDLQTPRAEITGTDNVYATGNLGLLVYSTLASGDGTADATFDNYLALPSPPPNLSISLNTFGDLTVFWPTNAAGWILQSSPSLDAPVWNDIDPPYFSGGGLFQYFADQFTVPQQHFRLYWP